VIPSAITATKLDTCPKNARTAKSQPASAAEKRATLDAIAHLPQPVPHLRALAIDVVNLDTSPAIVPPTREAREPKEASKADMVAVAAEVNATSAAVLAISHATVCARLVTMEDSKVEANKAVITVVVVDTNKEARAVKEVKVVALSASPVADLDI